MLTTKEWRYMNRDLKLTVPDGSHSIWVFKLPKPPKVTRISPVI